METVPAQLEITLYTTDPCARCIRAKDLLRSHGLVFAEVNLAKDPLGRRRLAEFTGQMTFPQIVIGKRAIGGFRELLEADRAGHLEGLLAA
jgi:glutaredoxin 3